MKSQEIRFSLGPQKVPYVIGRNIAHLIPTFFNKLGMNSKRTVIVTDPVVSTLHGAGVLHALTEGGLQPDLVELPGGEKNKNLKETQSLYEKFCLLEVNRKTPIIALGGGVTTDLTGFAASTFMRGVPLVLIPTTLLAQADAAVGGKTGVNINQGKNLIGSFYHPRFVLIDLEFLKTLAEAEFRNGLSEIVKITMLESEKKFSELERLVKKNHGNIQDFIEPFLVYAVRTKLDTVEKDPEERGERMLLNLGHTFAHALEASTHYEVYGHGEAVAIGLVGACYLAEKILHFPEKATCRVEQLLLQLELPTRYKGVSPYTVLACMASDKKKRESLRFVLPVEIGKAKVKETVPENVVLEVLERLKGGD